MSRMVVIGGGVIGLCCAYALKQRGADVTLIEARNGAHGASLVNAGWIAPSLSDPVPAPGLVGTSLKWMLKGDSPLYIHPGSAPKMAGWLSSFWKHCNARDFNAGMEATAELNRSTMMLYDEMIASGVEFEHYRDGLLFAYQNPKAMEHDLQAIAPLAAFGYPRPLVLDRDAVHAFEGSLASSVQSGYWLEQERSVRPETLVQGLRSWLEARGVSFLYSTRVTGFSNLNCGIGAVETTSGSIVCDGAVIAAGVWSGELARFVGTSIPLEGGKGYALDYSPPPSHVSRPLYLHEARVAVTPFDGAVRLAGTMEFSGSNDIMRPARAEAISRTASSMLANWSGDPHRASKISTGLRPMTPDGIPVIGLLQGYCNLTIATGHAMLGVTLGPATGAAIAEILIDGQVPEQLRPFASSRFRNPGKRA